MTGSSRSPRRDAALNRERLLEAGRQLLTEQGLTVTLHDVAARAGVGVGTAYRHFRSIEELADEVLLLRARDVVALLEEALADPDAWRAVTQFLDALVRMQFADRGLKDLLARHRLSSGTCSGPIFSLLETLVERAKQQGAVRPDLEPSDLIFIQAAVASVVDDQVREFDPDLHRRYLALLLDGVRGSGVLRSELPIAGLSIEQVRLVLTRAPDRG